MRARENGFKDCLKSKGTVSVILERSFGFIDCQLGRSFIIRLSDKCYHNPHLTLAESWEFMSAARIEKLLGQTPKSKSV